MSSRQLKKLHKQQELLRLQNLAEEEDASSEEEVAPPKPKVSAFAGFAALGGDNDGDDDEKEDEDNEEEEAEDDRLEQRAPSPAPAKKSKKPKKKKKKANKAAAEPEDNKKNASTAGMDEIDRALQELNLKPAVKNSVEEQQAQGTYDAKLARLLSISFDHLKVINELRAMFGQETIDSVRNQDEAQARDERRRNRRGGPHQIQLDMETFLKGRPGERIPEVVLRRNPFVQGKEHWPKASAGGLKMVAITDERVEPTEYAFTHDKGYELLEMQFFSLVDMMDPMRIVHFVHQNPYHVNALIQTSGVAKQDHNAALAGDLCERALFTFGRVTLSSFRKKLERGLARLEFRRPENRQFWLAGYHYIKSLMQKGTYDTALEWTKLFLSLSPNDEYALMNFTHVLAIHAYESKWLVALCNSAYFNGDEYDLPMKEYHRQTCVLAKLQLGDKEGALDNLVKGMETLPWLYSSLCSAVNIDTPRSIWGVQPRDDNDKLYTELYIHMAKDIWKRDGTELLKEAGERASKVDPFSLPGSQDIPLSIGRFVYLDNTPELMGMVPVSMLHASPNFDYDPLPPAKEDNIFSNQWQSIPW
ncbi:transcriptional repressor TCF25-domain-containing protein, partial [Coniella lustricola]